MLCIPDQDFLSKLPSALRSSTGPFYWVVDQLTGTIIKTAGAIYLHGHHPS